MYKGVKFHKYCVTAHFLSQNEPGQGVVNVFNGHLCTLANHGNDQNNQWSELLLSGVLHSAVPTNVVIFENVYFLVLDCGFKNFDRVVFPCFKLSWINVLCKAICRYQMLYV